MVWREPRATRPLPLLPREAANCASAQDRNFACKPGLGTTGILIPAEEKPQTTLQGQASVSQPRACTRRLGQVGLPGGAPPL